MCHVGLTITVCSSICVDDGCAVSVVVGMVVGCLEVGVVVVGLEVGCLEVGVDVGFEVGWDEVGAGVGLSVGCCEVGVDVGFEVGCGEVGVLVVGLEDGSLEGTIPFGGAVGFG